MGQWFGYVDKFIKKDFMFWKFKMETMLKVRDLWGFIDWKEIKPEEIVTISALVVYKKKERCTLNIQSVDCSNSVK
jgi:hypothetical protein